MIEAVINYIAPMDARPRYHANDASRDILTLDPRAMPIRDMRDAADAPTLDRDGYQLVPHASAVTDWTTQSGGDLYRREVHDLILALSGADAVVVSGGGILRYSEKSDQSGQLDNSRPARFIHIDVSDATATAFAEGVAKAGERIVITAGVPFGTSGATNILRIAWVQGAT